MSGFSNRGQPLDVPGKAVLVGRFVPINSKVLEGDLSQNAASGRATVFASTSESALARSG